MGGHAVALPDEYLAGLEGASMEILRNDRLQSAKQWFDDLPGRREEMAQRRRLFVHRAERQIGLTPSAFSCFKRRET